MAPTLVESFSPASKKLAIAMASLTLPCEFEGCGYVIRRDGGMPLRIAVELLKLHHGHHVHGLLTKQASKSIEVAKDIPPWRGLYRQWTLLMV